MDWSPKARNSILIALFVLAAVYLFVAMLLWVAAWVADKSQNKIRIRHLVRLALWWCMAILLLRSLKALNAATDLLPGVVTNALTSTLANVWLYFLVPLAGLVLCSKQFTRVLGAVYHILFLMLILYIFQSYSWYFHSHDQQPQHIPRLASMDNDDGSGNTYIFVFDEWGYAKTFGNPNFQIKNMPNLNNLLERSTLYTQAYSPGVSTISSLSRFLYSPDPNVMNYSDNDVEKLRQEGAFPAQTMRSIFDLTDSHFKVVAGTQYIKYAKLLEGHVDFVYPFFDWNSQYSLYERVANLLTSQFQFLRYFGIQIQSPKQYPHWMLVTLEQQRIRQVLNELLSFLPQKVFFFCHMLIPHYPYQYDRNWELRKSESVCNEEGYIEAVYATDHLIGDIVRNLTENGKFDSSLIIFMSDHAWRSNKTEFSEQDQQDPTSPWKHVFLLIKYPGQTHGEIYSDSVFLMDVHRLLKEHFKHPESIKDGARRWSEPETSDHLL